MHRHLNGTLSLSLNDLKVKMYSSGSGIGEEIDVEKLKLASLYFVAVCCVHNERKRMKKWTVIGLD